MGENAGRFLSFPGGRTLKKLICGLAALCLAVSLGGCAKRFTGGEDTPYPYEWTEKSKGTIVLSVNSAEAADCDWLPQSYDDSVLTVSEEKVKGDYHTYTITPEMPGRAEITFACEKQEGPLTDHRFEIHLVLDISEKNKASVAEHYQVAYSGVQHGGEGTAAPYLYQTEADGSLSVFLEDTSEDSIWNGTSDNEKTAVCTRQEIVDGGAWYSVTVGDKGTAKITFENTVSGVKVVLPVTVDADGNVLTEGTEAPVTTGRNETTEDAA